MNSVLCLGHVPLSRWWDSKGSNQQRVAEGNLANLPDRSRMSVEGHHIADPVWVEQACLPEVLRRPEILLLLRSHLGRPSTAQPKGPQ